MDFGRFEIEDGYLNFDLELEEEEGYGLRTNNGIMEFKNYNGFWAPISSSSSGGNSTLPSVEIECGTFLNESADIDCGSFI